MKSKITIDVDFQNQPVIKIQYIESEDVRDKLVKRFLEKFGGVSAWSTHYFMDNNESWISPIAPENLLDQSESIKTIHNFHYPKKGF